MEITQVLGAQPGDGVPGAILGVAVRGTAEEDAPEGCVRDISGVVAGDFERRKGLLALSLDLGLGERGVDDHIGEQIKGELGVVAQDAQSGERTVPLGAGVKGPARAVNRLGDVPRAAAACALVEQAGDELSGPGAIGRVSFRPRFHDKAQRHEGQRVALNDHDSEPVGKRLDGRQTKRNGLGRLDNRRAFAGGEHGRRKQESSEQKRRANSLSGQASPQTPLP